MATREIVVVGGGIAGVPTAYGIKAELGDEARVTVVSERPRFHFIPSNPWLALGWRRPEEVSFELEPLLEARGIRLRAQPLQAAEPEQGRLRLADGETLSWDYLVLATGIRPLWEELPGAQADARVHSVILPEEVSRAHAAWQEYLHRPGPVVIAAGPGASILGPMYEYAFLLDADLRRRGLRGRVPVALVTPEPYPGHLGLDRPVEREALEEALAAHDIEWIGNARLEELGDGQARFTAAGGGGTQTRPYDYAVVWPRFGGTEALRDMPWADGSGLFRVDAALRAEGQERIFALGTCTARERVTDTPVPVGVPDAVYPAQQQAALVARNVVHGLHGQPPVSAAIERERWIADMGERGAAYLSAPHLPLRDVNWLRRGRWVFEAKREFENYYIQQVLFGAGEHAHVATLTRRLLERAHGRAAEPGTRLDTAGITVADALRRRLEALAAELARPAPVLARQLLEEAVAEAWSYLDRDTRARAEERLREELLRELDAEQERVRFEGGAP